MYVVLRQEYSILIKKFTIVKRMAKENQRRRALEMKIENRKWLLGRPRMRWLDHVIENLKVRGVLLNEGSWEDRDVWRKNRRPDDGNNQWKKKK